MENGQEQRTPDTERSREQGRGVRRQVPRSGAKRRKQSYAKNKTQSTLPMIIIEQQMMMAMMMAGSRSNGR